MQGSAKSFNNWVLRAVLSFSTTAVILSAVAACSTGASSGNRETLTVFAASSLTGAFIEVAAAFEVNNPGVSVDLNFSGSQRLRFQLEQGARADIFASADTKQMILAEKSELLSGSVVDFATNTMVVVIPAPAGEEARDAAADIGHARTVRSDATVESLADLARKGVKLALAQPEVPAGSYARSVIQSLANDPRLGPNYSQRVLANVVSHESNVRSVLQKVALGEADAGLVYFSDAYLASNVSIIQVPKESNVVATYPVAALRDAAQPAIAEDFIGFLISSPGQAILADHGFGPSLAGPAAEPRSGRRPGRSYRAPGQGLNLANTSSQYLTGTGAPWR